MNRPFLSALMCCTGGFFLLSGQSAFAQVELDQGFEKRLETNVTGLEIVEQEDLWVMEVHLKPVRMREIVITDPITKEQKKQFVWYLAYRAIRRPVIRPADEDTSRDPRNNLDEEPVPMFVPEIELLGYTDRPDPKKPNQTLIPIVYKDEIIPEALAAISKREKRQYKHSVQLSQPLPDAVPLPDPSAETPPGSPPYIYGVAMFTGVDSEIDYFVVRMTGFSNGYKLVDGPEGNKLVERRVILQDFWRPGDEIDETEREVRFQDNPRWEYVTEAPTPGTVTTDLEPESTVIP